MVALNEFFQRCPPSLCSAFILKDFCDYEKFPVGLTSPLGYSWMREAGGGQLRFRVKHDVL
jgi:hypothetical protein